MTDHFSTIHDSAEKCYQGQPRAFRIVLVYEGKDNDKQGDVINMGQVIQNETDRLITKKIKSLDPDETFPRECKETFNGLQAEMFDMSTSFFFFNWLLESDADLKGEISYFCYLSN